MRRERVEVREVCLLRAGLSEECSLLVCFGTAQPQDHANEHLRSDSPVAF